MRDDTFFETHPCDLSDRDKHERGTQLAAKHQEILEHEENARLASKANKDKEKQLKKELARLARSRHTGVEDRDVECYQQPNLSSYKIETIRLDTGEVVTDRPMDPMERNQAMQGELPFNPPAMSRAIRAARAADPVHPLRAVPETVREAAPEAAPASAATAEATEAGEGDDGLAFNPLPAAKMVDDEDLPVMAEDGTPEE